MSDTAKLGTWTVPESPISIEYSLVVVEEIRRLVMEGFQKLSRGGIEVGGVLYGVREGETVRLLAVRPVACEHARGPAFGLSENDRAALTAQLKGQSQDSAVQDFLCLGWFVSHTRGGVELTESDLELFNSFFPEPWQVTLVVRPGRGSSMRAGFFVREFDGAIQRERSYLEFSFPDRLAAIFDRPPRPRRSGSADRSEIPAVEAGGPPPVRDSREYGPRDYGAAAETPSELYDLAVPAPATQPPSKKKWAWLAVWVAILALAGWAGAHYILPAPRTEPIQLGVAEKDGVLQIQWNSSAKPVSSAVRGTLDIVDGNEPHHVTLSPADLARGSFSYKHSSSDAEIRLSVEQSDGAKVQEASRFLGQTPTSAAKSDDLQDLQKRRDELEDEVKRLKDENESQASRIQQLERTVRILQTRLGNK